jgi:hypothetical protein
MKLTVQQAHLDTILIASMLVLFFLSFDKETSSTVLYHNFTIVM